MGVINEVLILFMIMAAGFYARRTGMIDAAVNRGLAELLLNITLPLMILSSFNVPFDDRMMTIGIKIFLCSVVFHAGSFLLSGVLSRGFSGDIRNVLRFSAIFSNCAFMGYPVLQSVYGKPGVFYGSIFTVPFIIALWTVGVFIFRGKEEGFSWRKVVFNPGILAVIAGITMFVLSWHLPSPVARACDLLGSTTTPLSMILIGAMLAEMRTRELIGGAAVYYAAFVRLILIPGLAFAVLCLLGFHGTLVGICVISLAMPVAANTAAFAEKFRSDSLFASRCVFVSTLLSVLTIPVFIMLIQRFTGSQL
ncbi:MAG: AEC family transporter [Candidatus Omnitrophica bacterium]|nr:AEC family transporter [Candidatus Omnitrophota bacterium]